MFQNHLPLPLQTFPPSKSPEVATFVGLFLHLSLDPFSASLKSGLSWNSKVTPEE